VMGQESDTFLGLFESALRACSETSRLFEPIEQVFHAVAGPIDDAVKRTGSPFRVFREKERFQPRPRTVWYVLARYQNRQYTQPDRFCKYTRDIAILIGFGIETAAC